MYIIIAIEEEDKSKIGLSTHLAGPAIQVVLVAWKAVDEEIIR